MLDQRRATAGDAGAGRVFGDLKTFPARPSPSRALLAARRCSSTRAESTRRARQPGLGGRQRPRGRTAHDRALRLAGLLMGLQQFDEALKQLDAAKAPTFEGLVADRRGDVLLPPAKARPASLPGGLEGDGSDKDWTTAAWSEAKLVSQGVPPAPLAAAASGPVVTMPAGRRFGRHPGPAAACSLLDLRRQAHPLGLDAQDRRPAGLERQLDGIRFPLQPAVTDGLHRGVGNDGTVAALEADRPRSVWRAGRGRLSRRRRQRRPLCRRGDRDNEVVVLDAGRRSGASGRGLRVVTPPLVAGERVFVMGVDRAVLRFDAI